ncbi:unnamed protein product, partial [Notodromas monacha]
MTLVHGERKDKAPLHWDSCDRSSPSSSSSSLASADRGRHFHRRQELPRTSPLRGDVHSDHSPRSPLVFSPSVPAVSVSLLLMQSPTLFHPTPPPSPPTKLCSRVPGRFLSPETMAADETIMAMDEETLPMMTKTMMAQPEAASTPRQSRLPEGIRDPLEATKEMITKRQKKKEPQPVVKLKRLQ